MKPIPVRKIEFVAKTLTDVGKGVFVVGFASYFFERFPLAWRVTFGISSLIVIVLGILLYPEEGGNN